MSGDVKVNSHTLVTNIEHHLKALKASDTDTTQRKRESGLHLLYARESDTTPSNTGNSQYSFVNLDQIPRLKNVTSGNKSAPVSLHPPTNIPVPPRISPSANGSESSPLNSTATRILPKSISGLGAKATSSTGKSVDNSTRTVDNSRAMFSPKAQSTHATHSIDSISDSGSGAPFGAKMQVSSTSAIDDIDTYTQSGTSQSRRSALGSSQISSSYDSTGFDDIDSSTQDPMQKVRTFASTATGSSQVVSTRLSSSTSASKGYDPYALVQRMSPSDAPISTSSPNGHPLSTTVPSTSTVSKPAAVEINSSPDPAMRAQLQSAVNRANLEFRKAKMLIENCTEPDDLDMLEPRLQAASASLREATAALENFDHLSAQPPQISSPPPNLPTTDSPAPVRSNTRPQPLFAPVPVPTTHNGTAPPQNAPSANLNAPKRHFDISLLEGCDEDVWEDAEPPKTSTIPASGYRTNDHTTMTSVLPRNTDSIGNRVDGSSNSNNRSSFGSLARSNSSVGGNSFGASFPTGLTSTSTGPTPNRQTSANSVPPPANLSHLESGSVYNINASETTTSTKARSSVEVVEVSEDEIDFEILERLETAAAARAVVRTNLPSTSSECTSDFDPIPAVRGQTIEQYDPRTAPKSVWSGQHFEWSQRINNVIQRTFGHQQWRTNQLEIVNAIMAKKNVFVTMPTGGGKSLCYQVPALASPGATIVIQPLISLIEDQMMILRGLDMPCKFLCGKDYIGPWGTVDFDEVLDDMMANPPRIKILFITPERLTQSTYVLNRFADLARQELVSLFVVDECHCVSQWGHEFRPQYKELSKLKEHCPGVPVLALTATATVYVKVDILTVLRFFDNPCNVVCFTSSFNRPNLYFEVKPKTKTMKDEIAEFIRMRPGQSGIVYCLSRADCEEFAAEMQARGFKCGYYHAHVPTDQRAAIQAAWYNNELQFICATIAFGMGINKPDVRWVIHASIPKSLEGFYQEAGRAGRDGDAADCVVYSSGKDMITLKRMALSQANHDPYRANDPVHANLMRLTQLATFLEDRSVCRRTLLMEYFGERDPQKGADWNCGNCDTCNNANHAMSIDASPLVKSILSEYRLILTEPEAVPRAPKEKGKRSSAPKASHYQTQVASGTLRERCISKGQAAFLDRHGIKTKAELRSFFDYVFGKLVMKGIFIDVSSIGVLGRKNSAFRMKFPPAHFMYELPQNGANMALNNFERNGCKLMVVWKHPAKGARNVWLGGDDDEEDIEDHAPTPKRAKAKATAKKAAKTSTSSSARPTASSMITTPPSNRSKATAAKSVAASASKATTGAASNITASRHSLGSLPLEDDNDDYYDNEMYYFTGREYDDTDDLIMRENFTTNNFDDIDEYAMNIDLDNPDALRSQRVTPSGNSTSSSVTPAKQTASHTNHSSTASTSSSITAKASTSATRPNTIWSFVAPPNQTASNGEKRQTTQTASKPSAAGVITLGDEFDDITDDPDLTAIMKTPTSSQPLASTTSPSSAFGKPRFIPPTHSGRNSTNRSMSIDLDDYQEDEDDIFESFQRPTHRVSQKSQGSTDPQKSLRDKLVTKMKALRTQIGKEESYNPSGATQVTSLFPDNLLHQIACELPRGLQQFTSVNGIGEKRSEKYGGRFVFVIEDFMEKHPELQSIASNSYGTAVNSTAKATSSAQVTTSSATRKPGSKLGFS